MESENLKNYFLIATPSLQGDDFAKSVVFLMEHDDQGAMGLVINKPLHVTLGNVLSQLEIPSASPEIDDHPILMGGPIRQDLGFVVHSKKVRKNKKYDEEIIISASKETLRMLAKGKGPKHYLVALGYAGWEPGQLEAEIKANDWLVAPFDHDVLFTIPLENRWVECAKLIGVDINSLSDKFGHA